MKNNSRLYQKKHGLPGTPVSSGNDGMSYDSGTNVYFGFINDFFDTISVPVSNLIRIARKNSSEYYTGIFYSSGGDQQNYDSQQAGNTSNVYRPITDFNVNTRYPDSYGDSGSDSSVYLKVDVADGKAKNGYWNTNDDSLWKIEDSLTHSEAGYSVYDIQELEKTPDVRISPSIGSTNGGRYFYIQENETNYIFTTLNEKYA